MGQFNSTPRPRPQPEQAHQSSSKLETSPSAPQRPFDQPSSIGHTISAMPSSPPSSDHPVGPVHPTPSSLPPLYPPLQFQGEIAILSTQAKEILAVKKAKKAKKAERRKLKRRRRLETPFSPLPLAQQPSDQPRSVDHTAIFSSTPPSNHPIGPVQLTLSSLPPLNPPSQFRREIAILSIQAKKMLAAKKAKKAQKAERRKLKRKRRLENLLPPSRPATRKQFDRQIMEENATCLLKEVSVRRVLQRAIKAATSPNHFPTIDIHVEDDDDKELYMSQQTIIGPDSTKDADCKATKTKAFAGLIVIQDYLSAMRQAISEHTKESALLTEPGRHSFHVDASVSQRDGPTGIAVVHKTHRQYWDSEWTAMGYRIHEALKSTEAEAWAIWQALQITLEKVRADRAVLKPQEARSIAVIYSDCQPALTKIDNGYSFDHKVVHKIIAQSIELQQLGVDVHLHWCPGHRGVPGHVLADLVSKRARRSLN